MRTSLLVASALMLAFAAFIAFAPLPHQPRFQSQEQQNRYVVERYVATASKVPVVYVGSSMTARLAEADPSSCGYDLALHGESSLTGLSVAALESEHPRRVFVEINVPERRANVDLLRKSERNPIRNLSVFATRNMPVNLLLGYLSQFRQANPADIDEAALTAGLATQRDVYHKPVDAALLAENLAFVKSRVEALEAKGTSVVFFELPVHPELIDMPRARQIREAFATAFPHHRIVAPSELAGGLAVRTTDGVHLAAGEAEIVAARLHALHRGDCPGGAAARPLH